LTAPPAGYNKNDYLPGGYDGAPYIPNGKAEMNVYPRGSEMEELNWVWPDANHAERQKLYQTYKNHALGYLYYLQHEMGLRHLGLPDDEFTENGHIPYRVFVREARRIHGDVTMDETSINPFLRHEGLIPDLQPTSIAVGEYPMDSKPVRTKVDLSTPDKGDGDFYLVNVSTAFQVPYGAILPKGVDGLLVPVALSATHVAFSSIRMDPTWTVLGQAAGVAAALSARHDVAPRDLPVTEIQDELLRQHCKLAFFWDVAPERPDFTAIEKLALKGLVRGFPDRTFQPDSKLTRAEAASLLARAFHVWPSVSDVHFQDVPYQHWAFRDVETLFDNGVWKPFGILPLWPQYRTYESRTHMGYLTGKANREFKPDEPVTGDQFRALLKLMSERTIGQGNPANDDVLTTSGPAITRGTACVLLEAALGAAEAANSR
jgi:hypothetical protein